MIAAGGSVHFRPVQNAIAAREQEKLARAQKADLARSGGDELLRGAAAFDPGFDRAERIELIRPDAAAAMLHARHEEQPNIRRRPVRPRQFPQPSSTHPQHLRTSWPPS